jgi:hypothetical protein
MIRVACVGNRRLEVSYLKDTDEFEVVIHQSRGVFKDYYIATLIITADEFEKLGLFFSPEGT